MYAVFQRHGCLADQQSSMNGKRMAHALGSNYIVSLPYGL